MQATWSSCLLQTGSRSESPGYNYYTDQWVATAVIAILSTLTNPQQADDKQESYFHFMASKGGSSSHHSAITLKLHPSISFSGNCLSQLVGETLKRPFRDYKFTEHTVVKFFPRKRRHLVLTINDIAREFYPTRATDVLCAMKVTKVEKYARNLASQMAASRILAAQKQLRAFYSVTIPLLKSLDKGLFYSTTSHSESLIR